MLEGEGLEVSWNHNLDFEVICFSKSIIHGRVHKSLNNSMDWYLTGVYRHIKTTRMVDFLDELRLIKNREGFSWLAIRDFNKILTNEEKRGGIPHSERQMENFRQALDKCELRDMGFKGTIFT